MELLLDPERYSSSLNQVLGPVQKSCFCRAERLNLGIKLDKSTAEAQCLNKTFALSSASSFKSSTRSGVLHDVFLSCQTKFVEFMMLTVLARLRSLGGLGGVLARTVARFQ